MGAILNLPIETLANILCRLEYSDVKICKTVCRVFRNVIEHTRDIIWVIELGDAGYAEPPWPRNDITLEEKFTLLRDYLKRTRCWDFSGIYDVLPSQEWIIPRGNTRMSPCISEGVFAQWSESTSPDSDYLRATTDPAQYFRLDVIQVPSKNRGTGWKHWTVFEPEVAPRDFAMSPSRDLLVIVETLGACYDRRPEIPVTLYTKFAIHLRTLTRNSPHPCAAQPVLYMVIPSDEYVIYEGFKFLGDLLAVNASVGLHNPRFRLFIWNWKSGILLVDHDSMFGGSSAIACYAFLSEQLIAIPRMDELSFRHNSTVEECALASIDIFHMDINNASTEPQPLQLLTTLDLPITPSPSSFHPMSQWEAVSMQTFSTPLSAEISGCQEIDCHCGWHKTFELMDKHRVLCINFDVWAGEPESAAFYIPFKTLLDRASDLNTANRPAGDPVPWDEWAQNVSWLRGRVFSNAGFSGSQYAYSQGDEIWPHADTNIYIHDLNPQSVRAAVRDGTNRGVLEHNVSIRWPSQEDTKGNKYTWGVMRRANAPLLEAYIDYLDLSDAIESNQRSSIMVFEDSIMILKQTTASYWKLEDGILLLTT